MITLKRKTFFVCLVLFLALRAVIPAGYMPAKDAIAKGQLVLDICSPHNQDSIRTNISSSAPDSGHKTDTAIPCLFANCPMSQALEISTGHSYALLPLSGIPSWPPAIALSPPAIILFLFPVGSRAPPVFPASDSGPYSLEPAPL